MTNYDKISTIFQPEGLTIALFKHQLASIYQMEKHEREQLIEYDNCIKRTRLGINADPTGYGKTLSMIGLILRDKMIWDLSLPFTVEQVTSESAGLIVKIVVNRFDKLPATLILVSSSIIGQWLEELSNTSLNIATVTTRKDVDLVEAEKYDVILVTTSMFNNLVQSYSKFAWKRFIFDEPGHIRVPGMKTIRAGFYWFVTATPNEISRKHCNCRGSFIRNIIGDYPWEIEESFTGMIVKNDLSFVKSSFRMPKSQHLFHKCFQPILGAISGIIDPTINTMIEAGNIEGAILTLGGTRSENIVDLVRKKKLEELQDATNKIRKYKLRKNVARTKEWTERQAHINDQIRELEYRFKIMLQGPCLICLGKLSNPILEPSCQNLFCGNCLLEWLKRKKSCPACRAEVDNSRLIYVANQTGTKDTKPFQKVNQPLTKLAKIVEIITNNKVGKFLIFSAYNSMFQSIRQVLTENNVVVGILKGSIKTRQKTINNFRKGGVQVILLNSTYNGAGINLQETTDLILYHSMTPSAQKQIIGRAERIGRIHPLKVHHLQVHFKK